MVRNASSIFRCLARRSKILDARLPVLHLRGLSMGDFQKALSALSGTDAQNLSAVVISRLTGEWQQEYDDWQCRDLSARRDAYICADGVYLFHPGWSVLRRPHSAHSRSRARSRTELVGFQVGVRESARIWRALLVAIKARDLGVPPENAAGGRTVG